MEKSIEEMVENDLVEQPVVSFMVHENDMNHKDADNERMHKTLVDIVKSICITFIILIVIFVTAYTVRTAIWQNTILRMNDAILEMASLHHNCGVEVQYAENDPAP